MKKGDIVNVYNYTLGGREFLEGKAKLIKKLDVLTSDTERWNVHFIDDKSDVNFERSINPDREKQSAA
jgi:hypothetical protein